MDKQTTSDFYQVKDLSLAAFLFSVNTVTLVDKQRLPNGTVVFLFSPRSVAETLVSQYWTLQAPPVQPKQLFSAQRDLKDMIFSG